MSAAAVSAGPFPLDYRFNPNQVRSISGSCTGADTITVLVSPIPADTLARVNITTSCQANASIGDHLDFFTTVSTYSGVFNDVINGPFCRIMFIKTGTSGAATTYLVG